MAELIINGNFEINTDDWTFTLSSGLIIAGGQSGNCLQLTNTGNDIGWTGQIIVVKKGYLYKFFGWHKNAATIKGTISLDKDAYAYAGDIFQAIIDDLDWTEYDHVFTALTNAVYISIWVNSGTINDETLYDSLSLRSYGAKGNISVGMGMSLR